MNKITVIVPVEPGKKIESLKDLSSRDKNVVLIAEEGKNPSENRNRGIKKAKTSLVAFTNAHTILSENWAEKVNEFFLAYPQVSVVGGPQLNYKDEKFFARASGYALSSFFGAAAVSVRYKKKSLDLNADENSISSANLICKRDVLRKVKFDEALYPGEDPKFISDAKKKGFRVAYSPDIVVYNKRREDIFSLAKQIFSYGKTRPLKEDFSESLKKPHFIIPSIFLIYLLVLPTLMLVNPLISIPLGLYIFLLIFFSVYEGIKNKDFASILLLPIIFVIIHLAYGLGFLVGLKIKVFD